MTFYSRYAQYHEIIFGETLFGIPPVVNVETTLTILPFGYNGLQLNWNPPPGNWNEQVLVRSQFGVPNRIYDGLIVLDQLTASDALTYTFIDEPLQPGLFYYYGLFVYDTDLGRYIMAAWAQGLVLSQWGFADKYQTWLPQWYTDMDNDLAVTQSLTGLPPGASGPLTSYLQLLGYETDWIRSEIETLFTLTSPQHISGALLTYMADNLGMEYEPELSMSRSRVLVENTIHLYKVKGTLPGLEAAVTAFSGFGAKVTLGPNLDIQLDDAAFDRSVGHWKYLSNVAIEEVSAVSVSLAPLHTSYSPANNKNILKLTFSGGVASLSTCDTTNTHTFKGRLEALQLGIPVSQAATPPTYVVSISTHPNPQATPADSVTWEMSFDWFDANGVYLSSTTGTAVSDVIGTWTGVFSTGSPPAGAAVFGRTLKTTGSIGAGVIVYMDAGQSEVNTQATPGPSTWDPPRDLKINLLPVRQNLVADPVGLGGGFNWTATNGTIEPLIRGSVTWPVDTYSGYEVTQTSGTLLTANVASMPVSPNTVYTFSLYSEAKTTGRQIRLELDFLSSSGSPIQSFSGGVTLSGDTITDDTTGFVRGMLYNVLSPAGAATATGKITYLNVGSGEVHYVGAVMLEPISYLRPYFDANYSPSSDYIFEGTANQSISDYYPLLQLKINRLNEVLVDYTPIGSTYSLLYGAKAFANINA